MDLWRFFVQNHVGVVPKSWRIQQIIWKVFVLVRCWFYFSQFLFLFSTIWMSLQWHPPWHSHFSICSEQLIDYSQHWRTLEIDCVLPRFPWILTILWSYLFENLRPLRDGLSCFCKTLLRLKLRGLGCLLCHCACCGFCGRAAAIWRSVSIFRFKVRFEFLELRRN